MMKETRTLPSSKKQVFCFHFWNFASKWAAKLRPIILLHTHTLSKSTNKLFHHYDFTFLNARMMNSSRAVTTQTLFGLKRKNIITYFMLGTALLIAMIMIILIVGECNISMNYNHYRLIFIFCLLSISLTTWRSFKYNNNCDANNELP